MARDQILEDKIMAGRQNSIRTRRSRLRRPAAGGYQPAVPAVMCVMEAARRSPAVIQTFLPSYRVTRDYGARIRRRHYVAPITFCFRYPIADRRRLCPVDFARFHHNLT